MDERPTAEYEPLRFKNPPIVEAIIGINVAPLNEAAFAAVKQMVEGLHTAGYKAATPINLASIQMKLIPGASSAISQDIVHGLQADSVDGRYRARFQRDGFLFSHLGHYESWELFRGEAHRMWNLYADIIGETPVTGFGVRYINKVFVPLEGSLSDYLTCYPILPDDWPTNVLESYMRLVMPIENTEGKLTHQHILLAPEKPGFAAVILDNDFRYPFSGNINGDHLWAQIDSVRRVKDEYFCRLVTPKMRQSFND